MLISLSFKITVRPVLLHPASFRASNAIPPVNAPSPITATTELFFPWISLALAIPKAAEIDVLLCPVLKQSFSFSFVFGKPAIPSSFLSVFNSSFLPVNILCVYVWCPTSQITLSSGILKTLWIAIVSSTTPKLDAKCPPFSDTVSNMYFLISSANCFFSSLDNFFTSFSDFIFSSILSPALYLFC